jgi:hypothetical protein
MPSWRKVLLASAFGLAGPLGSAAPVAHAAAPRILSSLDWSAPVDCPGSPEVRARLEAIVGRPLADAVDATIVVSVTDQGRYAADIRVRVRGRVGQRHLEEATCRVLAETAATVLALSIAPEETTPPEQPPSEPPAAPRPARDEAPTSSPPPGRRLLFAAGLTALADSGTLPGLGFGGGVSVAVEPMARLRVEALLGRWLAQSADAANQPFGASFELTSGDLRACWSPLGRVVTLGACAGFEVALLDASGRGSTSTQGRAGTLFSPLVGAVAIWTPMRRLAFSAHLDADFPVTRPTFVIVNAAGDPQTFSVHRPAVAAARSEVAAEIRF